MKLPVTHWRDADGQEKDNLLHKIVTLFFEDQIAIDPERGDLLFSKTGLNKVKKIFIEVLELYDGCAKKAEEDLAGIVTAARSESKKVKLKKAKEDMTPEERLKEAGLVGVKKGDRRKGLILP